MANEIIIGIIALATLAGFGMIVSEALDFNWRRAGRKVKCLCGQHAPDAIRSEAGYLVRRCLYCDRVVNRFIQEDNKIRRIH
jgi:hypothetical protein